jgi:Ca2+-binding RTX toxin-like protein
MGLFKTTNLSLVYVPKDLSQFLLPTPDYDDAWIAQQSLPKNWLAGRDTPGYTQTIFGEFFYIDDTHMNRAINIELFNPGGSVGLGSNHDDNIIGSRGNDIIWGNEGKDFIHGGSGNDTITGGTGNDWLLGGAGNDKLMGDTRGFDVRDDALADGNDYLNGGSGDDTLSGGGGKDTLIGGTGNDTASYEEAYSAIDASLLRGNSFDAMHTTDDTFETIENLTGSNFGDRLEGNAANNTIHGGDGYDFILGGAGDDVLFADSDGGYLSGGGGKDLLISGTGFNNLHGNEGDDIFIITSGDCLVYGGQGIDTVQVTGAANDWELTYLGAQFDSASNEYQNHYSLASLEGTLSQPIDMWGVENIRFDDGTTLTI